MHPTGAEASGRTPTDGADDGACGGAVAAWQSLAGHAGPSTDPVRWQFMASLARRAEGQPEPVRRLLHARLATAVAEYLERYPAPAPSALLAPGQPVERARVPSPAPSPAPSPGPSPAPVPSPALREAQRSMSVPMPVVAPHPLRASPLEELTQRLERGLAPDAGTAAPQSHAAASSPPDLLALAYFRDTWARLAVHRSLNQSLAKTPTNAGPLNSHRLVLRALALMREVSPAYLNRFVAQVDALMVLETMGSAAPPPAATPSAKPAPRGATPAAAAADGERKRKPPRARNAGRR